VGSHLTTDVGAKKELQSQFLLDSEVKTATLPDGWRVVNTAKAGGYGRW
jgi:hypothetical protein